MTQEELFKNLIAHTKEYGFIFPSSEIYDGLGAVYDYGQLGSELKNNIKKYWWDSMVRLNENIVGIDSAIFMHPRIWEASGHVGAFNDPLIDNKDSKKRYRADVLLEDYIAKIEEKINKDVEKGRKKFGEAFDEAQFFDEGLIDVVARLANSGVRVICAGLDQDFRGEPFGIMPTLLTKAEYVTKLQGICMVCGAPATRTQRIIDGHPADYDDATIKVGANESYESRCRHCHLVPRKNYE